MKIGVDLGGTNIRAALVTDKGVVKMHSSPLREKHDLESTLSQIKSVIRAVINPEVTGIGVGVPSVVDLDRGIVYDVVNIPSWKEVHLRHILMSEFGVPVFINNDVNCFVLGEKYFGVGRNYHSFVGITIGTGIGSGLILDNRLYSGSNCGAGEIGYLPYKDQDLEYYCSSNFFERLNQTTAKAAFDKAEAGDEASLALWNEFGDHLGFAMKSVLYAFDPEAIILGGNISKAFKYFEKAMFARLSGTHFPKSVAKLKFHISKVEHVSILGAAAQVDQVQEINV